MNALQTFEQQIKEYGTRYNRVETSFLDFEYYTIDDETHAIVVYDKEGNVDHATFCKIEK